MINQIKIGQFIAENRKSLNLTQKQLAEQIGVTDKTISKWETGNRLPDAALLMDLCGLLHVDVNELLKGERFQSENYEQNAKDNLVDLVGEINVIKQEKRGKYVGAVLGVLSIMSMIVMVVYMSPGTLRLCYFLDIPTLAFFIGMVCMVLTVTGCFHDLINAWKFCIGRGQISEREIKTAAHAVSFACVVVPIAGIMISIIGTVSVIGGLSDAKIIGSALAQIVLSVFYTALLELINAAVLFKLKKEECLW